MEAVPTTPPASRPPWRVIVREIIETILLTALIYLGVNLATGRFKVEGSSMEPSFHPEQYVLVDKVSYRLGTPQRGDVVVFQYPQATERDFIKRIIGLPGETVDIRGGLVYVNGQALAEPYISAPPGYAGTWILDVDQYFVLGDNRNSSSDSHSWGPLEKHYLIGRAVLVYWPPPQWGLVPHYGYGDIVAPTPGPTSAGETTTRPLPMESTATPASASNAYPVASPTRYPTPSSSYPAP
jgi:signal peptidase I